MTSEPGVIAWTEMKRNGTERAEWNGNGCAERRGGGEGQAGGNAKFKDPGMRG